MGGWIFSIFIVTLISVRAVRVEVNRPKFLIETEPQINHPKIAEDIVVNSDGQQTQGIQTSSFYFFQKNDDDSTHVDVNPNFEYQVFHSNNYNSDYLNNIQEITNDGEATTNQLAPQVISNSLQLPINQGHKVAQQNYIPERLSSNPRFLGYTTMDPYSKPASYFAVPEAEDHKYTENVKEKLNKVEANGVPGKYTQQKYVPVSPKYTYMNMFDSKKAFHPTQSSHLPSKINFRPLSKTIQHFFSPYTKYLAAKARREQSDSVNKKNIIQEDITPQPSENYEVHHEAYPDVHPEEETGSIYPSYSEVQKKRKEIHYHQHKHLHEHDHDQKHSHKHQSGHHHDHGHGHSNKHEHSHSHKNDHWHDHHGKNEHYHESDHIHGHHGIHDHKHDEHHGHKHHSYHHHGHESHHNHNEDHWNKHSHKHHSDHDHHHDHDHKHKGKHGHHHSQKHHHKHSGKY